MFLLSHLHYYPDSMWLLVTFGSIMAISIYFLFFRTKTKIIGKRAPKSKFGELPVVGHAFEMTEDKIIAFLDKTYEFYQGNFEVVVLGRRMLFLTSIEDYTFVMKQRPKIFRRERLFESWGSDLGILSGVFNAEGHIWERVRRLTSTAFATHNVRAMFGKISSRASILIDSLTEKNGQQVEGVDFFCEFMLLTFIELAFSTTLCQDSQYLHSSEITSDFKTILSWMFRRSLYPVPSWMWHTILCDKMERQATGSIARQKAFVSSIVEKALQQGRNKESDGKQTTLLDSLISAHVDYNSQGRNKLSNEEIYAQLYTYMVAGTETTSALMNMVLYYLIQPEHATLLAEVRSEVAQVLQSNNDKEGDATRKSNHHILQSSSQVEACVLLNLIIKEAGRLSPAAPAILFNTASDTDSASLPGGYIINPGDAIAVNGRSIMRNEDIYKNGNEFNPKRWMLSLSATDGLSTEEELMKMEANLVVFGLGPRVCPGMKLANMEAAVFLSTILHHFDFELGCPKEEVQFIYRFTAQPNALPFRFTLRKGC